MATFSGIKRIENLRREKWMMRKNGSSVGSVRNSNLELFGKPELKIFYIMRGTANGVRKRTQKRGRALQLNKSTP